MGAPGEWQSQQELLTATKDSETDGYALCSELGSHCADKRTKRGCYLKLMQQQGRQQNLVELYTESRRTAFVMHLIAQVPCVQLEM